MRIFNFLKRRKRRDPITFDTIRVGTILKTYPAIRSHVTEPYLLRVIESTKESFTTELVEPERCVYPHTHTFHYGDGSWEYHRDRFVIIQY